jgi:hypothetical protein
MDTKSFPKLFETNKIDDDMTRKLQKITAGMIGSIILRSNCAIRIEKGQDLENKEYDIGVKVNEKGITFVPLNTLKSHEVDIEEILFRNLDPSADKSKIKRSYQWNDVKDTLPEENKLVLVSYHDLKGSIACVAEYVFSLESKDSGKFISHILVNNSFIGINVPNVTHWMYLPCPPKCTHGHDDVIKQNEVLSKKMPFTQERKRKKKKKR